jgi:hypothetical protein
MVVILRAARSTSIKSGKCNQRRPQFPPSTFDCVGPYPYDTQYRYDHRRWDPQSSAFRWIDDAEIQKVNRITCKFITLINADPA